MGVGGPTVGSGAVAGCVGVGAGAVGAVGTCSGELPGAGTVGVPVGFGAVSVALGLGAGFWVFDAAVSRVEAPLVPESSSPSEAHETPAVSPNAATIHTPRGRSTDSLTRLRMLITHQPITSPRRRTTLETNPRAPTRDRSHDCPPTRSGFFDF